jgi:hypothetical protein
MAAGDGLVSMKPTSIAHSGTSASINADGGVDFTAVTSLSLNGVFTSGYDNYLVVIDAIGSSSLDTKWRLRVSGTDASGTNYTRQYIVANDTSRSVARDTSQDGAAIMNINDANRNGADVHFYGPALAQPTALRSTQISGFAGAYLLNIAATHSLSTVYDGFTVASLSAATMTGNVHVFGYEE